LKWVFWGRRVWVGCGVLAMGVESWETGNGCLTSMGEQSDTGFRWQEIELHEHAKLHHFGTT
ncbi:hypothetical protein KR067_008896, partial [Drosophila pandora]